jgi:tRNA/tmRNA/rRNA uracil-C5-methylase (TrmA/RlmC/RlmD family)
VYVSSSPLSFARDAAYFMQHGFALTLIQPLDFAPQTVYVETVGVLERRS